MKRRVLSTVLAFVLVVSFMPLTLAFAEKEVTTGAEDATEITETEVLSTQEDVVEVPESGGTFEALGTTDEEELETDAAGSSEEEAVLLAMDEQIGVAAVSEASYFSLTRTGETTFRVFVDSENVGGTLSLWVYEAGDDTPVLYTAELNSYGNASPTFTLTGKNLASPETPKHLTWQLSVGDETGTMNTHSLAGWNMPTITIENVKISRISETVVAVELDSTIAADSNLRRMIGGSLVDNAGIYVPVRDVVDGHNTFLWTAEHGAAYDIRLWARFQGAGVDYPDIQLGDYTVPAWSEDMAKQITSVTMEGVAEDDIYLYEDDAKIIVIGPKTLDASSIKTTIVHTGDSISPDPQGAAVDYTTPQTFTVTAEDGSTTTYTITFSYCPTIEDLQIERTGLYSAKVSFTSDSVGTVFMYYSKMPVSYEMAQAEMSAGQNSVTLSWQNASLPPASDWFPDMTDPDAVIPLYFEFISYVDANDPDAGYYDASWYYTEIDMPVWEAPTLSTTNSITSFKLAGASGLFLGSAIYVTVPAATVLTNLEPVITHNGVSIKLIGSRDFSAPVTYEVTAEDGSSKTYRVFVSVAANPEDPEHEDKPAIDASDFGSSDGTGDVVSIVTEDLLEDESNFEGLYLIVGNELRLVARENYTLERGSTKITLLESYLKTLGSGSYTFAAIYTSGLMATIDLQVALPTVDNPSAGSTGSAAGTGTGSTLPATGDSPVVLMAVIIVLLGGAALTSFALLRRRAVK